MRELERPRIKRARSTCAPGSRTSRLYDTHSSGHRGAEWALATPPRRIDVGGGVVSDLTLVTSTDFHGEDLPVPVLVAVVGYAFAVRRVGRKPLELIVVGELALTSPVGLDRVDLCVGWAGPYPDLATRVGYPLAVR